MTLNSSDASLSEIWKSLKNIGYDCTVSSLGAVIGKTKRLSGWLDGDGYLKVHVRYNNKWKQVPVHLLVALAFHGERPTSIHQVAHGNGIKLENNSDNLRWAIPKEQYEDRVKHGTERFGENRHNSKLTRDQVNQIKFTHKPRHREFSASALGRKFGVSRTSIWLIINGRAYVERSECLR